MQAAYLYACSENPNLLACLAIHSANLPSSSGTGCRLSMYLINLGLRDIIVFGVFNLESPAAIPEALCKEVKGHIKCL